MSVHKYDVYHSQITAVGGETVIKYLYRKKTSHAYVTS